MIESEPPLYGRLHIPSQWISVDDQLPEQGVDVLVYVGMPVAPSGEIDIAFVDDGEWIKQRYKGSVITHWMPLPTAPTGKGEGEG